VFERCNLRVTYVIDTLGAGGAERSLVEIVHRLPSRGVQASVVCFAHERHGVHDEVSSIVPVHVLAARTRLARVPELRDVIRGLEPDIVHTTLFEADVVGRLAVRNMSRIVTSVVNTSYDPVRYDDPNVSRWRLNLCRIVDGWTARRYTSHFHAISDTVQASAVRTLRIASERITVVPRGRDRARLGEPTDERREHVRNTLGLANDDVVVLHAGRHEFQKGIETLLRAAATLDGKPVTFLQAGRDGNASGRLRAMRRDLGLDGRFRFLGFRQDIGDLMTAADIFAFPSRFEGLGGAVIEAKAMGLPVVCTDLPALREVTREGVDGLIVPLDDEAAFADALRKLVDDAQTRQAMGARGRAHFDSTFEIERSVDRLVEIYHMVIAMPRGVTSARRAATSKLT
jgi:glycosyltransferase involved in cell wall biosynthesis